MSDPSQFPVSPIWLHGTLRNRRVRYHNGLGPTFDLKIFLDAYLPRKGRSWYGFVPLSFFLCMGWREGRVRDWGIVSHEGELVGKPFRFPYSRPPVTGVLRRRVSCLVFLSPTSHLTLQPTPSCLIVVVSIVGEMSLSCLLGLVRSSQVTKCQTRTVRPRLFHPQRRRKRARYLKNESTPWNCWEGVGKRGARGTLTRGDSRTGDKSLSFPNLLTGTINSQMFILFWLGRSINPLFEKILD